MSIPTILLDRSNQQCELCGSADPELHAYAVPPKGAESPDNQVILCRTCFDRISGDNTKDPGYWRCLTGSIWSEVPAVQALSCRILTRLPGEEWAVEALESVFLDEAVLEWAGADKDQESGQPLHRDAYGVPLEAGDTVILTQNLNVKGASFSAPKGTIVRKIRLVPDNETQIEGKIQGELIVILTKYVKKQA